MLTLRVATALATVIGSSALFEQCPPPVDEACPASAPEEGCECDIAEPLGCENNGEWNAEAFVCVDGYWTDAAGTEVADEAFCGGADAFYGGCFYNEETGSVEVACAVPGFIGISKAKARKRKAAARRLRPARA